MITELIEFEKKAEITNKQLVEQAEMIVNEFHKKQDGYVDMELISDKTNQHWQMIIHYQSMQDIEKVKENVPKSEVLNDFRNLVIPETMKVTFHNQHGKWIN